MFNVLIRTIPESFDDWSIESKLEQNKFDIISLMNWLITVSEEGPKRRTGSWTWGHPLCASRATMFHNRETCVSLCRHCTISVLKFAVPETCENWLCLVNSCVTIPARHAKFTRYCLTQWISMYVGPVYVPIFWHCNINLTLKVYLP